MRRSYDAIADRYDEYVGYAEQILLGNGRHWVGAQAHGDVLEIGVGTGRNFPFYAPDVRLTGIDLTPAMLQQARDRAATLGIDADLRLGDAQALDLPDDRFDAVVMTLVLSGVPDIQRAIAEAHRVLRHGGRLLVLDFVRSPRRSVRVMQHLLNPLTGRRYSFHLLSDPLDHLADAGFVVVRVTRSKAGIVERVAARKPSPAGRRRVLNPGGAFRDLVPHNDI